MILLIGSQGSMGLRYQAIMNYLGIKYQIHDSLYGMPLKLKTDYDKIIIATPTPTHKLVLDKIFYFMEMTGHKFNILCEKPISLDYREAVNICEYVMKKEIKFFMMEQYKALIPNISYDEKNKSHYDYFRTGKDGLWDFYQIIVNHKGAFENLTLMNQSPIFECTINNKEINIRDMDRAYIAFFKDWYMQDNIYCNTPLNTPQQLMNDHLRVYDVIKRLL